MVFSGRPLRAFATPYVADWERNRQQEIRELTARGIIPIEHDLDRLEEEGKLTEEIEDQAAARYVGHSRFFHFHFLLTKMRSTDIGWHI